MHNIKNLKIIEYTQNIGNKYELDMVAMFNSSVVSEKYVRSQIDKGLLDLSYHNKIVVMSKTQYMNLFDINTVDSEKELYYDLNNEQKEQM